MVRTILQSLWILHAHQIGVFIKLGAQYSVLDEVLHAGFEVHTSPSTVIHHNQIISD